MGISESSYKRGRKNNRLKIGYQDRGIIAYDEEMKEKKCEPKKGARALFKEKYKATGSVRDARKLMEQEGLSLDFIDDKVLEGWAKDSSESSGR